MNAREDAEVQQTPETVLEVANLHKWFGGLHALDDVSFSVRRGESVGLVGDNGAGKSTLLKTLSGVHEPTEGRIVLEGSEVKLGSPTVARSHGVETVYQDLALIGRFTIAENFFLGRELRRFGILRKRAMRNATDEALRELDVRVPFANRRVSKMSGGQRQAVAIARGAYWGRKMLLLDEPTAALGVRESGEVLRLLDSLKEGGITTILVTHNIDHLWHVCDRILVLRRGRLVADVAKSEVTPAEVVGHITGAIEAHSGDDARSDSVVNPANSTSGCDRE
jgi:ABC-type sugar transport system ATPase subunit